MQKISNLAVAPLAAGYQNKKRGMRQQHVQRTPNQPISSGSFYPSPPHYDDLYLNPNSVSLESFSDTSDRSSSLGGTVIDYQSMGRGSSLGLSVSTLVNSSCGGNDGKGY